MSIVMCQRCFKTFAIPKKIEKDTYICDSCKSEKCVKEGGVEK